MLSLNAIPHSQDRPLGVRALTAICWVLSAVAFTFTGLLFGGVVPLSAGAFLLGGGMEQVGPFAFLIYGTVLSVLGIALWRRWKGARRVAIVIAGAGIALAVPAMSSAVADARVVAILREGIQIIVRVMVIFYLSQPPVKEWFANPEVQLAHAGPSNDTNQQAGN